MPAECAGDPERVLSMRPADMSGFDPHIHEFLKGRMNRKASQVDNNRGSVAWFYLNYRSGRQR